MALCQLCTPHQPNLLGSMCLLIAWDHYIIHTLDTAHLHVPIGVVWPNDANCSEQNKYNNEMHQLYFIFTMCDYRHVFSCISLCLKCLLCSTSKFFHHLCLSVGFGNSFQLVLLLDCIRVWWALKSNTKRVMYIYNCCKLQQNSNTIFLVNKIVGLILTNLVWYTCQHG
jgi:hypothetical protein